MFQEFEQALQATGIDLDFRTWAGYESFFPAMWESIRSEVESRGFEEAADRVRANAVQLAQRLDWLDDNAPPEFNENQACQVTAALDLYHYVTPKILLLTANLLTRLDGGANEAVTAFDLNGDNLLHRLFKDVQRTMPLPLVSSSEAKLALWPDYLQGGWEKIQALVYTDAYQSAARELREFTRSLRGPSVKVSRSRLIEIGENPERIIATNQKLEQLLPPLIINITLFQLDWQTPEKLSSSPYRYH